MKNEIKAAFKAALPVMVTFIVLGMGYGILMNEHGCTIYCYGSFDCILFEGCQFYRGITWTSGDYRTCNSCSIIFAEEEYDSQRCDRNGRLYGYGADGFCLIKCGSMRSYGAMYVKDGRSNRDRNRKTGSGTGILL